MPSPAGSPTKAKPKRGDGAAGAEEKLTVYQGHESVQGICKVVVPSGKKVEHIGIKIELIGQIGGP